MSHKFGSMSNITKLKIKYPAKFGTLKIVGS